MVHERRYLTDDPGVIERFGDPYRPLEPECKGIQFDKPLTPSQLQRAGELIAGRPDVELYVYFDASRDLDFLQYFPGLGRLHVALYGLEDIAGFSHVAAGLEGLTFGKTKKTFSLRFLDAMPRLRNLFLVHHKKDLPAVSNLANLTSLGLSGITLPDLGMLVPLTRLSSLSIFLGGTTNLTLLARLASLEELLLMRISKLADLAVLGDLDSLRKLELDGMRHVTSLPSLARLALLEEVILDTMKRLTDLSPLAAAPALRKLTVSGMPHLTAESFRCLVGHPHLADLWDCSGRSRVNQELKRMFGGIVR